MSGSKRTAHLGQGAFRAFRQNTALIDHGVFDGFMSERFLYGSNVHAVFQAPDGEGMMQGKAGNWFDYLCVGTSLFAAYGTDLC